ncbi:MAG TPA: hypothetical protein ENN46_02300 [Candidatus Woesearchaeota archaeon]|nr:hypothetical protein [Candidatus Woesearchaeota archaeon]
MGISETRARIKELEILIKNCEDEKSRANSLANSLLSKYIKGQITHEEYEKELRKQLGGRDRIESIAHYNSFMRKLALEKSTLNSQVRQHEKTRRVISVAAVLLMFAFLFPFLINSEIGTDALTGLLFSDDLSAQNQTPGTQDALEAVEAGQEEPQETKEPAGVPEETEEDEPQGIKIRPRKESLGEEATSPADNISLNLTINDTGIIDNISLGNLTENLSDNETLFNLTPPEDSYNISDNVSEVIGNISLNITDPVQNITVNKTEPDTPVVNITEPDLNATFPDYNETLLNETEKPDLNQTEQVEEPADELKLTFFVKNQTVRTNITSRLNLLSVFNKSNTTFILVNYDNLTASVSESFLSFKPNREGNFSLKFLASHKNNTYHSNIFFIFVRNNATLDTGLNETEESYPGQNETLDNKTQPIISHPIPDVALNFGEGLELNLSVYFRSNSSLVFTYAYNYSLLSVKENSSIVAIEPIKNINTTSRFRVFSSNLKETATSGFNITLFEDSSLKHLLNDTDTETIEKEPNNPPEIIGNISLVTLESNKTLVIDLDSVFFDPDNDSLVFLSVSEFPVVSFIEFSSLNLYAEQPFEGERKVKVMAFDTINITALEFYVNYSAPEAELNISLNKTGELNLSEPDDIDNISELAFDERLADLFNLELDSPAEWRRTFRVNNDERKWKYKTVSVSIPKHAENISVYSNRAKLKLLDFEDLYAYQQESLAVNEDETGQADEITVLNDSATDPDKGLILNESDQGHLINETPRQAQEKGFSVLETPDSFIVYITDFYEPFTTKEFMVEYYTKGIRSHSNYSIVTGLTHYKEFKIKNLDNITYYGFSIELEEKPAYRYEVVSPTNSISFRKPTPSNTFTKIFFDRIEPFQVSSFSIYSIYDTFTLSSGSWINSSWNISFKTEFNSTLTINSKNNSFFELKNIACLEMIDTPEALEQESQDSDSVLNLSEKESSVLNDSEQASEPFSGLDQEQALVNASGETKPNSSIMNESRQEAESDEALHETEDMLNESQSIKAEDEAPGQAALHNQSLPEQPGLVPEPEAPKALFNISFEQRNGAIYADSGLCARMEMEFFVPSENTSLSFTFMNITKSVMPTETGSFRNFSVSILDFCPTCSDEWEMNSSFVCAKINSGSDSLDFYPVLSFNLTALPRKFAHELTLCLDTVYSSHPNTIYAAVLDDSIASFFFGNLSAFSTKLDAPDKFVSGRPYTTVRINQTITELSPRQVFCGTINDLYLSDSVRLIILGQDMKGRAYPFSCFLTTEDSNTELWVKY